MLLNKHKKKKGVDDSILEHAVEESVSKVSVSASAVETDKLKHA